MQNQPSSTILALDVGERRIGVAVANVVARIASPLLTIDRIEDTLQVIADLCDAHQAVTVVVGLPRSLDGNDTPQTLRAREFADALARELTIPVHLQDEALTSVQAEDELKRRGARYTKGDIDALAASYILDDYLKEDMPDRA